MQAEFRAKIILTTVNRLPKEKLGKVLLAVEQQINAPQTIEVPECPKVGVRIHIKC